MKRILSFLVFSVCLMFLQTANSSAEEMIDVIYLKDGRIVRGTIIEQVPNKQYSIRKKDDKIEIIPFEKVEKISKEVKRIFTFRDKSYTELGVTTVTPGGLNIVLGRWLGPIGVRLSGMYWGESLSGFQFDLSLKLSDNESRTHSLGAVLGHSHTIVNETKFGYTNEVERNWDYVGIVYTLNWGGFYLQPGVAYGSSAFPNPQVLFQIGYVYRFL